MKGNGKMPLALLEEGEKGIVVEIDEIFFEKEMYSLNNSCETGCVFCRRQRRRERGGLRRLIDMGFEKGKELEMIRNRPGQPLIVRLENSQIAISRGLAMKIYVKKEEVGA